MAVVVQRGSSLGLVLAGHLLDVAHVDGLAAEHVPVVDHHNDLVLGQGAALPFL